MKQNKRLYFLGLLHYSDGSNIRPSMVKKNKAVLIKIPVIVRAPLGVIRAIDFPTKF